MKIQTLFACNVSGFYWNGAHLWPITGYPAYYINRLGQVYSAHLARLLKDSNCAGYRQVNLRANGQSKTVKIHRLVALAFLANPQNKPDINHKDGDKANNSLCNLEWCTAKENVQHAIRMGLFRCSKSTGRKATREPADGKPKKRKANRIGS